MSLPSPARGKGLAVSILSLSLLTVMAGAAVAPALGVIQAYFSVTRLRWPASAAIMPSPHFPVPYHPMRIFLRKVGSTSVPYSPASAHHRLSASGC